MSISQLSRIERGLRNVSFDDAARILNVYGYSIEIREKT
jgi:transcriptional regulator with XRE-family HTH domain